MFDRIGYKLNAKKLIKLKGKMFINVAFLSLMISLAWISYAVDFENLIVYIYIGGFQIQELFWAEAIHFFSIFVIVLLIWEVLVQIPFKYGMKNYFCEAFFVPDEIKSSVWIGFRKGYSKIMATELIANIIIALGYLCFIIPGIYFQYSYKFIPYLLKDEPDLPPFELIKKSKMMMKKHYFEMIFLDITFLPYTILGYISGSITRLYSIPYIELVYAQVYEWLKKEYKESNV